MNRERLAELAEYLMCEECPFADDCIAHKRYPIKNITIGHCVSSLAYLLDNEED